jgi:hypothetical protein
MSSGSLDQECAPMTVRESAIWLEAIHWAFVVIRSCVQPGGDLRLAFEVSDAFENLPLVLAGRANLAPSEALRIYVGNLFDKYPDLTSAPKFARLASLLQPS